MFFGCDPLPQALAPNINGVRGNRVLLRPLRPLSSPALFALLIMLSFEEYLPTTSN